jgi:predicted DNA-binding antitoxin AbrB/MazE fold protein
MTKNFKAVYENGILRPLEAVPFREHDLVDVTVTNSRAASLEPDIDFLRYLETQADDSITLEEVRAELSKIPGSMAEVIRQEREDRV